MAYLDLGRLEALDPVAYQTRNPYPFVNPRGILHEDAYRKLVENLPPIEMFEEVRGKKRAHGQKPHDRLTLEYQDRLAIPPPWQEFIDELRAGPYVQALCRLVGVPQIDLRFHWHWATRGDSVSPHCDARRKYGSHIFYLNTEQDWDPAWGGETLVLGNQERLQRNSAPSFEDFDEIIHADAGTNRSFIFTRRGDSWHGVQEITCPEGRYRKVFIVVINTASWRHRLIRRISSESASARRQRPDQR